MKPRRLKKRRPYMEEGEESNMDKKKLDDNGIVIDLTKFQWHPIDIANSNDIFFRQICK